jgi:MerR family transcriptional regulator, redox-sensitive transcriptional activator SoxR
MSAHTGVAASALRYYESLGLIAKPRRQSTRRVYPADAVHYVAVIQLARRCGFRLDEIGCLLRGASRPGPPSAVWRAFTKSKRAEIDGAIQQFRAMRQLLGRLELCRCDSIVECGRRLK